MMKKVTTVLFSLLVLCGILEVVLRTTHLFHARVSWIQPDPEIAWRFTPGREYWFFGENDHAITGRINSMGWRDRERSKEKPADTYRVAVLGDSYVEAFQVELDSTFCAIAERRLNSAATGRAAEVMNFGRSGMSSVEELTVLESDIFPCHPDAVVLLFTPHNDIADVNPVTATNLSRPFFRFAADSLLLDTSFANSRDYRLRQFINPVKQRFALVSLITERFNTWRLVLAQRRQTSFVKGGLNGMLRLGTAHPDSVFVDNYALCKNLIVRMARACASRHVVFIVAAVPIAYTPEDLAVITAADSSFVPDFFDRDLGALASAQGFEFIGLNQLFAANAREGNCLHWAHWNYRGHCVVGAALDESIRAVGYQPAP